MVPDTFVCPGGSSYQPVELLQTYPVSDPSLLAVGSQGQAETYTVTFAAYLGELDANCYLLADLDVYNNVRQTSKSDNASTLPLSGVFQTGDGNVYAFAPVAEADAVNEVLVTQNQTTGNITVGVNGVNYTYSSVSGLTIVTPTGDNNIYALGATVPLAIYGGAGSDWIVGGDGGDTIYGGASGGNRIIGGSGGNTIYGGAGGGDWITAGSGGDTIYGGAAGGETIVGGSGDDTIYSGAAGGETITGGNGDDTIYGQGTQSNTISDGDGNDTIYAGPGGDTITAGNGNDQVFGGSGDDSITVGDGNDWVQGGGGSDSITAGAGNDWIYGGAAGNTVLRAGVIDSTTSMIVPSENDVMAGSGNAVALSGQLLDSVGGQRGGIVYYGDGSSADFSFYGSVFTTPGHTYSADGVYYASVGVNVGEQSPSATYTVIVEDTSPGGSTVGIVADAPDASKPNQNVRRVHGLLEQPEPGGDDRGASRRPGGGGHGLPAHRHQRTGAARRHGRGDHASRQRRQRLADLRDRTGGPRHGRRRHSSACRRDAEHRSAAAAKRGLRLRRRHGFVPLRDWLRGAGRRGHPRPRSRARGEHHAGQPDARADATPANADAYANWQSSSQPVQIPVEGQGDRTELQFYAALDSIYADASNWLASLSAPTGIEFWTSPTGGSSMTSAEVNADIAAGDFYRDYWVSAADAGSQASTITLDYVKTVGEVEVENASAFVSTVVKQDWGKFDVVLGPRGFSRDFGLTVTPDQAALTSLGINSASVKVSFVQLAYATMNGSTLGKGVGLGLIPRTVPLDRWFIDSDTLPFYPHTNGRSTLDGLPFPSMDDEPGPNSVMARVIQDVSFQFETCAVMSYKGTTYLLGCVQWGFSYTIKGPVWNRVVTAQKFYIDNNVWTDADGGPLYRQFSLSPSARSAAMGKCLSRYFPGYVNLY